MSSRGSSDIGSGGVMLRIGLTKRAISTIALPYSSYASASTFEWRLISLCVSAWSFTRTRWSPFGIGVKVPSSGRISRPWRGSSRSRMISGRSSDTTSEHTEKRKPGNTSSVTAAPPSTCRRSTTSTFRPARARYAAAVRPLCPPPITIASYFIRDVTSVNGCPRIPNSKFLILNYLFVHHPAFHHPHDALELRDVADQIAADRDEVGELARL